MGSTTVQAPQQVPLAQQGRDMLQAQVDLAPQQLAAYQQTAPQYAATDVKTLGQSLFGPDFSGNLSDINNQLTQQANLQTAQANTALRGQNIQDVGQFGQTALNQYTALNPQLYGMRDYNASIAGQMKNPYQEFMQNLGATNTYQAINPQQAQMAQISGTPMVEAAQMAGGSISGLPNVSAGTVGYNNIQPGTIGYDAIRGAQIGAAQMRYDRIGGSSINAGQIGAQNVSASTGNPVLDALNQRALAQQPSSLQTQQNQIASGLLDQGGNLSPQELRAVQQASRAGFAARGLDATNASVVDEALQTDMAKRARLQQNLGMAQGVQNQGLAEQAQQQNFGLGVNSANYGYGQLGLQGQLANQGTNLAASQSNLGAYMAAQQANQQNQLQAGLANQAAGLTAGSQNLGAQMQASQLNQQNAYQTQLANQQAGLTAGQTNLSALMAAQQANQAAGIQTGTTNAQLGLQAGLANQQTAYNSQLANLQAALQAQQFNAQAQMQAQQLNQAAALQAQLANQQNAYQTQALNAGLNLTGQQTNAANAMAAQNQQFGQQGALFGITNALDQANFGQRQQALNNYAATQFNPYATVLGQNTQNVGLNQSLLGNAFQNNSSTNAATMNQFNPFNAYGQNYFDTGYNAQAAANIATANNNAGMIGGLFGAAGALGGGLLGNSGLFTAVGKGKG